MYAADCYESVEGITKQVIGRRMKRDLSSGLYVILKVYKVKHLEIISRCFLVL